MRLPSLDVLLGRYEYVEGCQPKRCRLKAIDLAKKAIEEAGKAKPKDFEPDFMELLKKII